MTKSKRDTLIELDQLVSDRLLEALRNDKLEEIPLLSNAMKYLAMNQQVSEKAKVTANDRHKKMIEEAKKQREQEIASTK